MGERGKDSPEEERMDYLEFIARVTSHIPHKGQLSFIAAKPPPSQVFEQVALMAAEAGMEYF